MCLRQEFRLREEAVRVGLASRGRIIRLGMGLLWCKVLVIRFRQRASLDQVHKEIRHCLHNSLREVAILTILLIFEKFFSNISIKFDC